jgi:hypothetical protein
VKKVLIVVVAVLALSACTEQQRARSWGGTATKDLAACTKLVNVTWKEGGDLWILTRQMRSGETPERYEFTQDLSLGGEFGKIVIQEHSGQCPAS